MPKILVVDDDILGREPLCRFLQSAGHRVECASNGQEALSAILAVPPDVVVLDLSMPEMDGAKLLEILHSYVRLQSVPVIVLTGLPDGPSVEQARSLKVHSILEKTKVTFDEILHAVNEVSHRVPK